MQRRRRPDIMKQTKDANTRERRRLARRIEGYGGINAQYRFDRQQTENECALIRRELAQSILDETKRKRRELMKRNERKMSRDTDPTLLLMKEREERRRKRNFRLLVRAHERQKRSDERVKEFVAKLEREEMQNKQDMEQKIADILILVDNLETEAELEIRTGSRLISSPESRPISRAWKEARKTRYIRTRKLRDFEVELTAKEIFSRETTSLNESRIQTATKNGAKNRLYLP